MKKISLLANLISVFCFTNLRSQIPYFIPDLNAFVTVYDTAKLKAMPLLNIGITSTDFGIDTNFIGIVDPKDNFKKLLDYPYPTDNITAMWDDLVYFRSNKNGSKWNFAKINTALSVDNQPTDYEYIATLDSLLVEENRAYMSMPYPYIYHGRNDTSTIYFDSHDHDAFELNGSTYLLVIGTHNEWYDGSNTWLNSDSVLLRFTTLHIINAQSHTEVARWEPQHQGFTLENFGLPKHIRYTNSGLPTYSHPHINVLEALVDSAGKVNVFCSSRHPGNIFKLSWDTHSTALHTEWVFGNPPRTPVPPYLPTITNSQLDACHGAGAYVVGDTTYMATYNNSATPDSVYSQHQVWKVYHDTATLIWHSPNIGVVSICKGFARWSAGGRYLITGYGICNGAIVTPNGNGGNNYSFNYDKLQIWDPWTNAKILGINTNSNIYAEAEFIDSNKIICFADVAVTVNDSITLSHTHPGLKFWTIGQQKIETSTLTLPLLYLDSLNLISAWIQTGFTGVWRVNNKSILSAVPATTANQELNFPTIQKIGQNSFKGEHITWTATNLLGQTVDVARLNTGGMYVVSGYDQFARLIYRKRHIFTN